MSRTTSDGRDNHVPMAVTTKGRLIWMGWAEHCVEKLIVGERRIAEAKFGIRRSLFADRLRTVRPASAIIVTSFLRVGGFDR